MYIPIVILLLSLHCLLDAAAEDVASCLENEHCMIIDAGTQIYTPEFHNEYMLRMIRAIREEKVERVRELIAAGVPINSYFVRTKPLYEAVQVLNPAIVELLLTNGANPNDLSFSAVGIDPETALYGVMARSEYARSVGFDRMYSIIYSLIHHGADPMILGDKGLRPIDQIAQDGAISNKAAFAIIALLLKSSCFHARYEQVKHRAAEYAYAEAQKFTYTCPDHCAMFHARAQFIKAYPAFEQDPALNLLLQLYHDDPHVRTQVRTNIIALQNCEDYSPVKARLDMLLQDCSQWPLPIVPEVLKVTTVADDGEDASVISPRIRIKDRKRKYS